MGEINTRELQFMVGRKADTELAPMGFRSPNGNGAVPLDTNTIVEALSAVPELHVVRVVKRSKLETLSVRPPSSQEDIVVVRARSREHVEHLNRLMQRNPALLVERDHLLQHLGSFTPQFRAPRTPSLIATASIRVNFHVQDASGRPLENAEIVVYGDGGTEALGKTNVQGDAAVNVAVGFLNQVAALYIKPAADYWEKFIERPALDSGTTNTVTLFPLQTFTASGFPGDPFYGWGQRLMGQLNLDSRKCDGAGARVAIIDSGCDTQHPALSHITVGRDYTNLDANHEPDLNTWRQDLISHGTHCAGVIAGNGERGHIRGFAPKAEVHILKVFPGGAFNNLVAAINYCIDNNIHVVNCSLGSDVGSQLVAQAVQRARQAGVAVFVAAGNSAGIVQFPANVPGVLCVSALGQAGNFPDYTYHARTVPDGVAVVNGEVYPAKFTCHGPEVGVSGPGVAIISSVPGGGYAAWDGTSMADPHLTGLGALLAAHHPLLSRTTVRDAAWVDTLFGLVRSAALPTGLNPQYGGAGLPNAALALNNSLKAQSTATVQVPGSFPPDIVSELVKAVVAALPREVTNPAPAATEGGKPQRPAKH